MKIKRRMKKMTPAMIKTRIQVASFDEEESVKRTSSLGISSKFNTFCPFILSQKIPS